MRLLLDQDVYALTERFLRRLGHDVVLASQLGLSQAADEMLLRTAGQLGRILVTRDRDFSSLVFLKAMGSGVLYLRILPATQNAVHSEMERVLNTYSEEDLTKAFVVIEPAGHRIRRIPRS